MVYTERVKKYLEYCEFRKGLDRNTLKAYGIDLKQFFECGSSVCGSCTS